MTKNTESHICDINLIICHFCQSVIKLTKQTKLHFFDSYKNFRRPSQLLLHHIINRYRIYLITGPINLITG
jgi:hypothetical protein